MEALKFLLQGRKPGIAGTKCQVMECNWKAQEIIILASRWHCVLLKSVPAKSRIKAAQKKNGDNTKRKKKKSYCLPEGYHMAGWLKRLPQKHSYGSDLAVNSNLCYYSSCGSTEDLISWRKAKQQ